MKEKQRCGWCIGKPLYEQYHDEEWGVPVWNDRKQFEFLVLESAQAGLSWWTILQRRENYRKAFAGFDPEKVAKFNQKQIEKLLQNEGIIRNRAKIEATVNNARVFLKLQEQYGDFCTYFWNFADGKPIVNRLASLRDAAANTPLSDQITKDLKQKGFKFMGSTVMYAHMQATGMVNDHLTSCFRHKEVQKSKYL
jgi:DNA-3-methyladenine glycosylase I